jgi:hypothetical protein
MSEESRALPNALELASDIEDDNFRGDTMQIVNVLRQLAEEYEISRRDYEVMYKFYKSAEATEAIMVEWMKHDLTGDSDYPTTYDCFVADHPEIHSA